jgi:hypothetical protein
MFVENVRSHNKNLRKKFSRPLLKPQSYIDFKIINYSYKIKS